MSKVVRRHQDLDVWKRAFELAMAIFEISKNFPKEERYALTDQIRRSSRSIAANIAEAWQRRTYEASFRLRLNDSMAEAAESQDWVLFAYRCGYITEQQCDDLIASLAGILSTLQAMTLYSARWCRNPSKAPNNPQLTTDNPHS